MPLSGIRAVLRRSGEVVVAEVRPLGSPAACCVVTTLSLGLECIGWENSRVSVTIDVAAFGRGVLGAAITVGVEKVAWLGFSVAIVGVFPRIGVPRVAWSVPSDAIVGVLANTGVPKVA